jgi:hypothetical protein
VLVDWACARRGNPALDVAFAILSVRTEGARVPDLDLADEPALAALISGHVAVEASSPAPDWAPEGSTLRADQLGDLRHALTWAAETLGLDALPATAP